MVTIDISPLAHPAREVAEKLDRVIELLELKILELSEGDELLLRDLPDPNIYDVSSPVDRLRSALKCAQQAQRTVPDGQAVDKLSHDQLTDFLQDTFFAVSVLAHLAGAPEARELFNHIVKAVLGGNGAAIHP